MPRRHPMRGCTCPTCTNERLANLTPEARARKNANERRYYRTQPQDQYEQELAQNRERYRRKAEARDQARLATLQGDDA